VPDTTGYVEYSDEILAGSAWLRDAGLDRSAVPVSAVHMAGYPLLMAAVREVAGPYWTTVLVVLQAALSLTALAALCALRRPLGLSHRVMLFALFNVATTSSLVYDAALLTDSFHASLLILAITMLTITALSDRPLRWQTALAVGLLLAGAFLLRDAMSYLWLALLPLLACAAALPTVATEGRRAALRGAVVVALALSPLFAAYSAYSEWNRYRTGTPFVTTIGQLTLLLTLVTAAKHEPAIFAGDTPLDRAARATLLRHDYHDVQELNQRLFDTWHQTASEISAAAYEKYFTSWWQHPTAMARAVFANLREKDLFVLVGPIKTLREYQLWATGSWSKCRGKSGAGDPWCLLFYSADLLCKALAVVILACFLLLTPWRAWRAGRGSAQARVGVALWLLCVGWYAIFAMVTLETRYLAPVLPFAVLIGLANIVWLVERPAARS
jgi:hypothetical protein